MKLAHALNLSQNYPKALQWGRMISITGFSQLVVQGVSLISGLIVIRMLTTGEYALYTLVNTMVGTMTILADGGVSTGVMAQGGRVWDNPKKLGAVLITGLELRKKFAVGSLAVAIPVLFFLLQQHSVPVPMAILLLLSLIPAFLTTLSGSILEIPPKLRQDIPPLQKIQVLVNSARLIFVSLTLFAFPLAFLAILAAGIPQYFGNRQLRKVSSSYIDWAQGSDLGVQHEILRTVRRILPTTIYYCVSGQITIWLISIFGTTTSIAQIGALGRLAMILNVANILFATLITPRFARLPNVKTLLVKRYVQIQTAVVGLCVCIVTTAWVFQKQILWILGEPYENLKSELILNITGSCLTSMAAIIFALYTSRGWVIKPVISIPINLATIFLGTVILDITTVDGILLLNILVAAVQVIMNMVFITLRMAES